MTICILTALTRTRTRSDFRPQVVEPAHPQMKLRMNRRKHGSIGQLENAGELLHRAIRIYGDSVGPADPAFAEALGLLAENTRDYEVHSNRESGYGRYDVMMCPKSGELSAVLMEFKVYDKEDGEETLEDTADNALRQIERKQYEQALLARGIPRERILKYGFAFRGKECLIRKSN